MARDMTRTDTPTPDTFPLLLVPEVAAELFQVSFKLMTCLLSS